MHNTWRCGCLSIDCVFLFGIQEMGTKCSRPVCKYSNNGDNRRFLSPPKMLLLSDDVLRDAVEHLWHTDCFDLLFGWRLVVSHNNRNWLTNDVEPRTKSIESDSGEHALRRTVRLQRPRGESHTRLRRSEPPEGGETGRCRGLGSVRLFLTKGISHPSKQRHH